MIGKKNKEIIVPKSPEKYLEIIKRYDIKLPDTEGDPGECLASPAYTWLRFLKLLHDAEEEVKDCCDGIKGSARVLVVVISAGWGHIWSSDEGEFAYEPRIKKFLENSLGINEKKLDIEFIEHKHVRRGKQSQEGLAMKIDEAVNGGTSKPFDIIITVNTFMPFEGEWNKRVYGKIFQHLRKDGALLVLEEWGLTTTESLERVEEDTLMSLLRDLRNCSYIRSRREDIPVVLLPAEEEKSKSIVKAWEPIIMIRGEEEPELVDTCLVSTLIALRVGDAPTKEQLAFADVLRGAVKEADFWYKETLKNPSRVESERFEHLLDIAGRNEFWASKPIKSLRAANRQLSKAGGGQELAALNRELNLNGLGAVLSLCRYLSGHPEYKEGHKKIKATFGAIDASISKINDKKVKAEVEKIFRLFKSAVEQHFDIIYGNTREYEPEELKDDEYKPLHDAIKKAFDSDNPLLLNPAKENLKALDQLNPEKDKSKESVKNLKNLKDNMHKVSVVQFGKYKGGNIALVKGVRPLPHGIDCISIISTFFWYIPLLSLNMPKIVELWKQFPEGKDNPYSKFIKKYYSYTSNSFIALNALVDFTEELHKTGVTKERERRKR